jgi:PadR family transcriptional regulator PadR
MDHGLTDLVGRMRRSALEYCALGLLREEEWGAFDLVRALAGDDGIAEREGTVYPVLAQMRRDGLVTTSWRELAPGGSYRYYAITEEGCAVLDAFVAEWLAFRTAVDAYLGTQAT